MNTELSLAQFRSLPRRERLIYFHGNASFVSKRTVENYNIELFRVSEFFVELWYDTQVISGSIMMKAFMQNDLVLDAA